MTNEKLLREAIIKSGYKITFIADKMGISYQTLLNKITNLTEFKGSEIQSLSNLLNLDKSMREAIFFGDCVDK